MAEKPNVVLIIADQWATQAVDGSGENYGVIQTPGIDRLAREGMRFTQSYSTFPLCGPARATLFTGLMPQNHRILNNEEIYQHRRGSLPTRPDITTLGREFKRQGYRTAYFGKEHAAGYAWDAVDCFGSMKYSGGGMLAEGCAYDQIFTRDAIEFIRQDHDRPFYMTLSLINPHDICKVLGGKLAGASIADALFFCRTDDEPYLRFQQRPDLPDSHRLEPLPGMQRHDDYMYQELKDWSETEWKRFQAVYYLLLEKTDWFIELLLDALRAAGLDENTIVVFTTNHGEMLGSHGLIAKTVFYEESAKTMMLLRHPPQIAPGRVDAHSLINTQDLMPTLLDLCGLDVPDGLDGKSFKALISGEADAGDFSRLFAMNFDGWMLRRQGYKYVHSRVYGVERHILFDLEADPQETRNVFGHTAYAAVSAQLRTELDQWLQERALPLTISDQGQD